jgi:tRNA pseudouridine55 synthase
MPLNGVLVVDKPAGPTSHDVVARVRRALGEKRVGHAGTLDPLATGVLALLVGRATRLSQFLVNDEKEYIADVRLGVATPTYDAEGLRSTSEAVSFRLQPEVLENVLASLRGTYLQTPPPYSAKKVGGTRAYELARRNAPPDLAAVEVTVTALDLLPSDDPFRLRLRVACTSGFYVRTLAHELGQRLGCGAHLEALRRTRAGEFTLDEAVGLESVQDNPAGAAARIIPLHRLLGQMPAAVLNQRGLKRVVHGNDVGPQELVSPPPIAGFPARVRLFDETGTLVAIAEAEPGGVLHPAVVLG